jgi:small multidrug resistance pump
MHWIYLAFAILFEVAGTTALKAADGFTRPLPVIIVVVGYLAAFFFLGLSLKSLPVGIAYAVWAAIGMVLIAIMGWLAFGEQLDAWAIAGIMLIVIGVVLVSGVSRSVERTLPVDPGSEMDERPANTVPDPEM